MRHTIFLTAAIALVMLSTCSKNSDEKQVGPIGDADTILVPDESMSAEINADTAAWIGKWIGVEGMYVDIKQTGEGKFSLDMQSNLNTKGSYEGVAEPNGITFKRGGETLTLRKSDGDAIDLKWLAGKKDCLIVKQGEGYCRD